jgi:hypothetical protein
MRNIGYFLCVASQFGVIGIQFAKWNEDTPIEFRRWLIERAPLYGLCMVAVLVGAFFVHLSERCGGMKGEQ